MATRETPTSAANGANAAPNFRFSSPTPTAKAAALAECPEGIDVDDGVRTTRARGTASGIGRRRDQTRFATWLVTMLLTARLVTPRAAPRWADADREATSPTAMANHSRE